MPHAGEADTAGRGIHRETRVQAAEEGGRRIGNTCVEEMLDPDLAETLFRKLGGCPMPEKPTQQEEEYFARLEFERRRKGLDERETRAWRRCWIPTLRRLSSGSKEDAPCRRSRHSRKRNTSRDSSSSDGGRASTNGKPRRPKKNDSASSPLPGDGARSVPAS